MNKPMRTPRGSGETPTIDVETALVNHLRTLMSLQRWPEARVAARELATRHPHKAHYRALLALARGHEAALANDYKRAREEWQRAITLEPTLEDAALALRRSRPSLFERLFRR